MSRKLILYIAASLDGFISAPNDDLSFLSLVEKEGEDYGYTEFLETVDTIILGSRTYDWVMKNAGELAYPNKKVYVISSRSQQGDQNVEFYSGDLQDLIHNLKNTSSEKHIFCDGGANVVNQLLKNNLFDELVISIVPILLGEGTRLFQGSLPTQNLELISSKQFETGLVQLKYKVK